MRNHHILKLLRITSSCSITLLLLLLFLQPQYSTSKATWLQFTPGLLQAFTRSHPGLLVLLSAMILIALAGGRLYCSFICPIGVVQDIAIRLRRLLRRPVSTGYTSPHRRLRYTVLAITVTAVLTGSILPAALIEPFANFGRQVTAILKPTQVWLNNTLFDYEIWVTEPYDAPPFALVLLMTAAGGLLMTAGTAFFFNRLFCNTLCPVGAILGLLGRYSRFKIVFQPDNCKKCGRCQANCKTNCIDARNLRVDNERCVRCFNCLSSCRLHGLRYTTADSAVSSVPNLSRRDFIAIGGGVVVGAALRPITKLRRQSSSQVVMPPGAMDLAQFTAKCISCQLCVSNCPGQVLKPAGLQYGIEGFLQPRLDFNSGYCEYDCQRCTAICPTGALTPLTLPAKQHLQLGIARYHRYRCVVITGGTHCGACAEQCPTGAVHMVEWHNGLTIPQVEDELCIGCGACENICPVRPQRAITVEGKKQQKKLAWKSGAVNNHLRTAVFPPGSPSATKSGKSTGKKDFPF